MRLLVTRPEPQASAWVEQLKRLGVDAHALPLIAIEGPINPSPVIHLWQTLDQARLLMFVSPSAVDWFFRLKPAHGQWPERTLAAAPGPGTAKALRQAAEQAAIAIPQVICPSEEAPQFDSETLWPLLAPLDWMHQSVWIISGGDRQEAKGRVWLSSQLQHQGAQVSAVLAYQRHAARWTAAQKQQAQQAIEHPDQHTWLFSSSEAIDHLIHTLAPHQSWQRSSALVTHPKIAQRAQQAGFGQVSQTRPTPDSVAGTLLSSL